MLVDVVTTGLCTYTFPDPHWFEDERTSFSAQSHVSKFQPLREVDSYVNRLEESLGPTPQSHVPAEGAPAPFQRTTMDALDALPIERLASALKTRVESSLHNDKCVV